MTTHKRVEVFIFLFFSLLLPAGVKRASPSLSTWCMEWPPCPAPLPCCWSRSPLLSPNMFSRSAASTSQTSGSQPCCGTWSTSCYLVSWCWWVFLPLINKHLRLVLCGSICLLITFYPCVWLVVGCIPGVWSRGFRWAQPPGGCVAVTAALWLGHCASDVPSQLLLLHRCYGLHSTHHLQHDLWHSHLPGCQHHDHPRSVETSASSSQWWWWQYKHVEKLIHNYVYQAFFSSKG